MGVAKEKQDMENKIKKEEADKEKDDVVAQQVSSPSTVHLTPSDTSPRPYSALSSALNPNPPLLTSSSDPNIRGVIQVSEGEEPIVVPPPPSSPPPPDLQAAEKQAKKALNDEKMKKFDDEITKFENNVKSLDIDGIEERLRKHQESQSFFGKKSPTNFENLEKLIKEEQELLERAKDDKNKF